MRGKWIIGLGLALLAGWLLLNVGPRASIWVARGFDSFPNGSYEDREAVAKAALIDGVASLADRAVIRRNPIAAASASARAGDWRLIQFQVDHRGSSGETAPAFAGVDCALAGHHVLLTRATWSVTIWSAIISGGGERPRPLNDLATAIAFNRALLASPGFPYADVCAATDVSLTRTAAGPLDLQTANWWTRLSPRPAVAIGESDALSVAVRNGRLPPSIDVASIDDADEFGMTALSWAAARASRPIVRTLLDSGADPWFGDYCGARYLGQGRRGAALQNQMISPIVIAIATRRADIVADMLRHAPRKLCPGDQAHRETVMEQQFRVLHEVSKYAEQAGMKEPLKFMITDFIVQNRSQPDGNDRESAYDGVVKLAWESGVGDLFKARPDGEVSQSRELMYMLGAYGSATDVRYWVERLNLRTPDELVGAIGRSSTVFAISSRPAAPIAMRRADYAAKVTYLLDRMEPLDTQSRIRVLRTLVESGSLGPLKLDPPALRLLVGSLAAHGYDFDDLAVGQGTYNRTPGAQCTLLMLAIAYTDEECGFSGVSAQPELARALLEAGANPNLGRSAIGQSALDLARSRIADGPLENQFKDIERMLIARGAEPTSTRRRPYRSDRR